MSTALADFLIELSNPSVLEQFRHCPDALRAYANLSESDRLALQSGDWHEVHVQAVPEPFTPAPMPVKQATSGGRLVVVGTGIKVGQMTVESQAWIQRADKVLYCVADAATERLIQKLNPTAESLTVFYGNDKLRSITYRQMVDRTVECVRAGVTVCGAFYGHPGVFAFPTHEAMRRVREEGFETFMLPGVSALDCLIADLGIEIAKGCQILEASDLLMRRRVLDTTSTVVLWQVGVVLYREFNKRGYYAEHLPKLLEVLVSIYGPTHECILYEAARYAPVGPSIQRARLCEVRPSMVNGSSTMILPPRPGLVQPVAAARLETDDVATVGR